MKNSKKLNLHIFVFPLILAWYEIALHISDRMDLKFAPIYVLFAFSLGFAISAVFEFLTPKASHIAGDILAAALGIFYCVEFTCKAILQTYYPFSVMGTAVDNKLGQFIGIIVRVVLASIPKYILIMLPMLLIWAYRRSKSIKKFFPALAGNEPQNAFAVKITRALLLLLIAAAFQLEGYWTVALPKWNCDLAPLTLYNADTDYNDQVEELGIYSFIRLDIKHSLYGAGGSEFDASALEALEAEAPDREEPQQEADPIDRSPNILDVDLKAVAESTTNKDIKWLAEYFGSLTPTNKNEYTGMFKGYNVVFMTVEAGSGYALNPKYTPTLWKMAKGGFVFRNFYTALHYTSTSNGECQNLLGLYPKNGNPISIKRTGELGTFLPFTLAQGLGREGYKNWGYHNNWDLYGRMYSHSNLGYYWQFSYNGLHSELKGNGDLQWPQKDTVMVRESLEDYAGSADPFNVYYITISGHTPFGWNYATSQYKEELADAPWSETTKGYMGAMMEADRSVQMIVDTLAASGQLDKTLFVVVPDHIPYSGVEMLEELSGLELGSSDDARAINEQKINFELYHSGLIIWSASMEEPVQVDKVCCQVDILPTLNNLLGLDYDSRMLSGTDILSDSEGLVVFSSKCWKSDRGFYNRYNQEFTPAEGVSMSEEETKAYVDAMKSLVQCKLDCTAKIIENDFYNVVFGDTIPRVNGEISKHN